MPTTPIPSRNTSPVCDSPVDSGNVIPASSRHASQEPQKNIAFDGLPLRRHSPDASSVRSRQPSLHRLQSPHSAESLSNVAQQGESDSDSSDLDGPQGAIADWRKANDADRQLDLSGERATTLPPIPANTKNLSIEDNELKELPQIPEGIMTLEAADNKISRLPDSFLESLFNKGKEGYFDFTGNPLAADQIGRIREVTQAPGYSGPTILFSAPASMVFDDIKDLTDVGKSKLVGYLTVHKIENVEVIATKLRQQGLVVKLFSQQECGISTGAFYAFDDECLSRFLQRPENKEVLEKYDLPDTPADYVQYIATHRIQKFEKPDLFDLIALTFNDPGKEYDGRRPELADLKAS